MNLSLSDWATYAKHAVIKVTKNILVYKTDKWIYCMDVSTGFNCSGSWPFDLAARTASTWPPSLHMSAPYTAPDGICLYFGCIDLQGRVRTAEWLDSVNPYTQLWPNGVNFYLNFHGTFPTTPLAQTYFYSPYNSLSGTTISYTSYYCWSWITKNWCAGTSPASAYSLNNNQMSVLRLDSTNPFCAYYTSNTGIMGTIDLRTRNANCLSTSVIETDLMEKPPTTCSGKPAVLSRESLTVTDITNGTASTLLLTVISADGELIDGWSGIPLNVGESISLMNLTNDLTGPNPSYSVVFVNATGAPAVSLQLSYAGPAEELCFVATSSKPAGTNPFMPFVASIDGNNTLDTVTSIRDCAPQTITGTIWIDADNDTTKDPNELPYKNRPVKLVLPNGTVISTTPDPTTGAFAFPIGYMPDTAFTILDFDDTPLASFTTDSTGSASIPIPIPPPAIDPTGQTVNYAGNSSSAICADANYDVVVGSLIAPGTNPRQIQVDFTAGSNYTAGSVQAPAGWAVEYSGDGGLTWFSAEPSPASLVTNIRAISPANTSAGEWVNSTGNTAQMFVSTIAANAGPASLAPTGNGGDTNYIVIATKLDRVFFFWHHIASISLDCRVLSTGAQCSGYNPSVAVTNTAATARSQFAGYLSTDFTMGYYNPKDGNLYLVVLANANGVYGRAGLLCVDIGTASAPPQLCSTPFYQFSSDLVWWYGGGVGTLGTPYRSTTFAVWMKSVDRYFVMVPQKWQLHCWDWSTKTNCTNFPMQLVGSPVSGTDVDRRHYMLELTPTKLWFKTDLVMYCLDVITMENCTGNWPMILGTGETVNFTANELGTTYPGNTWPPAIHRSVKYGPIDGLCHYWGCHDLEGTLRMDWIDPNPYRNGYFAINTYYFYEGTLGAFVTTPAGWTWFYNPIHGGALSGKTDFKCWSWPDKAPCGAKTYTLYDESVYMSLPDPANAFCVWFVEHWGKMKAIDGSTGAEGCPATVKSETGLSSKPTTSCSGRETISYRDSLTVSNVRNGTIGDALLTVLDTNGIPLDGWTAIPMAIDSPLSLRNLTTAMTGPDPTFSMSYVNVTGSPMVDLTLKYVGPGPELCLQASSPVSGGQATTPLLASISNNGTTQAVGFDSTVDVVPC